MKKLLHARPPSRYLKATSCVRASSNIITVRKGKTGGKKSLAELHSIVQQLYPSVCPGYEIINNKSMLNLVLKSALKRINT